MVTHNDNENDPPPSKGTNEPWKRPGQASQNPDQKITKPDLDKWKTAIDKLSKIRPESQARTDLIDKRGGAEDPVTSNEQPLPEGLKRPRVGPDHKETK